MKLKYRVFKIRESVHTHIQNKLGTNDYSRLKQECFKFVTESYVLDNAIEWRDEQENSDDYIIIPSY